LNGLGIDCSGKRARQMRRADYDAYDYLIGMDGANIRNIERITGGDPEGKISFLLAHASKGYARYGREVADPWYTGDFEATYRDVKAGCEGLLEELKNKVHGI
ncbi:MAG: low molecular weight phosphotyrosine protein phosphatase, partial [Eubacteriales bacterium]|nr:low molecular weight phosphotyrosine protein phosphatase [Eubacteriales bacterium]